MVRNCEACGDRFNDSSASDVCEDCQESQKSLPPYELAHYYGTLV